MLKWETDEQQQVQNSKQDLNGFKVRLDKS